MSIFEVVCTRGFMKSGEFGVLNAFSFDSVGFDVLDKCVKEVKNVCFVMVVFFGMVF